MLLNSSGLILIIIVLRKFAWKLFPGRMFVLLWMLVLLRLMLPVKLPIFFKTKLPIVNQNKVSFYVINKNENINLMVVGGIIWGSVAVIFLGTLFYEYYKGYVLLAQAVPFTDCNSQTLKEITKRKVKFCVSDRVVTPVTYGILKPHIVLPESMNYNNASLVQHIIIHEAFHIYWMDNLVKFLSFFMRSIYWFNPLMWLLCFYLSKDIEMACDENVISYIGHEGKKEYALSLYEMAEYYSENFRLFNGFGKSAVVERIERVMKYKKRYVSIFVAILIIAVSAVSVFAAGNTSNINEKTIYKFQNLNTEEVDNYDTDKENKNDLDIISSDFGDGTEVNISANDTVSEETHYNLHRKYREWYPEITDEEALEIEKLHEYNRNFARKTTGEIVEVPQN